MGRGEDEKMRKAVERGDFEPWYYPNSDISGYVGTMARCRYHWGFYAWKQGIRGVVPSTYSYRIGTLFNDFDDYLSDCGFTYPGPDGLIQTLRWEGAREGMDDMKYVYTLTTLIKQARDSKKPKVGKLAAEAENMLGSLKKDIPDTFGLPKQPDEVLEVETWSCQNAQAYRWYIATWIMKLTDALCE